MKNHSAVTVEKGERYAALFLPRHRLAGLDPGYLFVPKSNTEHDSLNLPADVVDHALDQYAGAAAGKEGKAVNELPLSKTLSPTDFDQLTEELAIVDEHFTKAREQHPMRRWEYAMALHAQEVWWKLGERGRPMQDRRVADVGGAGSPFYHMVGAEHTYVIDPDQGLSLADYLKTGHPQLFPQVYCLSVLEHVDNLDQFLYHLSCLVAPGGLLFLTMDACGCPIRHGTEEKHHFHWMRKRIFTMGETYMVWEKLAGENFDLLGQQDPIWHGEQVYDYSFYSLALVKRP